MNPKGFVVKLCYDYDLIISGYISSWNENDSIVLLLIFSICKYSVGILKLTSVLFMKESLCCLMVDFF